MIAAAGGLRLAIGFALIAIVAMIAAAAPLIAPYDPARSSMSLLARRHGPIGSAQTSSAGISGRDCFLAPGPR
jgi:ABC-type dipeptide/oligopeptide/nickel transport system permease subunit